MSKVLISYFSASGNTKKVAEKVATSVGGDLFEIEPKERYTEEDLNWMNKQSRSSVEMNENIKPEIANKVSNLNEYDKVIIAFPVWWYKEPTIIDKFLDENDMSGKEIYVFVTSGGSSVDASYKSLQTNYSSLNFVSGKKFTGSESEEEYRNWIK